VPTLPAWTFNVTNTCLSNERHEHEQVLSLYIERHEHLSETPTRVTNTFHKQLSLYIERHEHLSETPTRVTNTSHKHQNVSPTRV
jgi:uncharacterized protein YcgL (UPF0745 family)